jgi:hypothetical protein
MKFDNVITALRQEARERGACFKRMNASTEISQHHDNNAVADRHNLRLSSLNCKHSGSSRNCTQKQRRVEDKDHGKFRKPRVSFVRNEFGVEPGSRFLHYQLPRTFKNRKLCAECGDRKALFKYRGRVRFDKHHTLCLQCYRSVIDRLFAKLAARLGR